MDDRGVNLIAALAVALQDEVLAGAADAGALNATTAAALATLHGCPGEGIDALSGVVGLTGSGTVRLVAGLVDQGLVEKRPGRTDGRAVALHLTGPGEEMACRVLAARRARAGVALQALTSTEQRQLTGLAERMLSALVSNRAQADRICRLCDYGACPQDVCPVETAVE
jgi:DNA-binding MarR family transcriptional regulator